MSAQALVAAGSERPVREDILACLLGLLALAVWEWSRLDLTITRSFGSEAGFYWRDNWLTAKFLYDGSRWIGWLFFGALLASVWRPQFMFPSLSTRDRVWWIATTLVCVALIPVLKRASSTSCPWSLVEFGGEMGRYVPHWVLGQRDGGPGGCFPSGHASTAFAFLPGWFALRRQLPRAAHRLLWGCLLIGAALGMVQTMRGAHFISHSMWTAWICWVVGVLSWHSRRVRGTQLFSRITGRVAHLNVAVAHPGLTQQQEHPGA